VRKLAAVVAFVLLAGAAWLWLRPASPPVPGRPLVTKEESITVEGGEHHIEAPLAAKAALQIAESLAARQAREGALQRALDDAKRGQIDALELGRRARAAVQADPRSGRALLQAMLDERSPENAMQLARALGPQLDDPALRSETLDALEKAQPRVRAQGLLALLGRSDPEALQLEADSLGPNGGEARSTAAFLLANANGAQVPDDALVQARAALGDRSADALLREQCATLLGRSGAPDSDAALLQDAVRDADPAVRMRALAALEQTGSSRFAAALDTITNDPTAPERLTEMAAAWRGRRP
jgi:HEAT repeats